MKLSFIAMMTTGYNHWHDVPSYPRYATEPNNDYVVYHYLVMVQKTKENDQITIRKRTENALNQQLLFHIFYLFKAVYQIN